MLTNWNLNKNVEEKSEEKYYLEKMEFIVSTLKVKENFRGVVQGEGNLSLIKV